ncbi:hypothetical protein MGYG_02401 [Nannizzia gypsea CBS 118893]|uniref:Uncharacterized protein n=1 Tax=Arthroderma gypseum (strain ATCC MYA-4604 / CBS 118893) TaxID=535722 RepID=E4URG7_ARTGP|nr:hypothetical protein MGYG_02401 [Nannizzia gypsea CBS 118893]EFQ99389.1 hypothetical protein MGYG_02401 [Nannizzia gypsea CBS 118893]
MRQRLQLIRTAAYATHLLEPAVIDMSSKIRAGFESISGYTTPAARYGSYLRAPQNLLAANLPRNILLHGYTLKPYQFICFVHYDAIRLRDEVLTNITPLCHQPLNDDADKRLLLVKILNP